MTGEVVVATLLAGFPLVGLSTRRWSALLLPLAGWPFFYVGLDIGWWLDGTGDGWEQAALIFTAVGLCTTALAVAVGRRLGGVAGQDANGETSVDGQ